MSKDISLVDIMSIDVDNLKQKQHDALKNHAINILKDVIELLETENYSEIQNKFLEHSPAGDGYGEDNCYINFGLSGMNGEPLDLDEVIDKLNYLKI